MSQERQQVVQIGPKTRNSMKLVRNHRQSRPFLGFVGFFAVLATTVSFVKSTGVETAAVSQHLLVACSSAAAN